MQNEDETTQQKAASVSEGRGPVWGALVMASLGRWQELSPHLTQSGKVCYIQGESANTLRYCKNGTTGIELIRARNKKPLWIPWRGR